MTQAYYQNKHFLAFWLFLTISGVFLYLQCYDPPVRPNPTVATFCSECPGPEDQCDTCTDVNIVLFVEYASLTAGADLKLYWFLDYYNNEGTLQVVDQDAIDDGTGSPAEVSSRIDSLLMGIDLVVISESVASGKMAAEASAMKNKAVPIFCMEIWNGDNLGILDTIGNGKTPFGMAPIDIVITSPSHPLAANLDDTVEILGGIPGANIRLGYAGTENVPITIAKVSFTNTEGVLRTEPVIIAYDTGDTLIDTTNALAPARRYLFSPINQSLDVLTNDGNALMVSAFNWLTE